MLISSLCIAQTAPTLYYDFDQTSPLAPRVGTGNLTTGGYYAINAGAVGNSLDISDRVDHSYSYFSGGTVTPVNGYTVQLLFKPGWSFLYGRDAILFSHGNSSARFQMPYGSNQINFVLMFDTRIGSTNHTQTLKFTGVNRASLSWILDNQWHHLAFTLNASTGQKRIYIDGLLVNEATTNTGSITAASDQRVYLNQVTNYVQYYGNLDEIAFYTVPITANQVYQNYLDFKAGQHYTTTNATSVPATPKYVAPLDTLDFPYGYVLGSLTSKNCSNSALTQLENYPLPRYTGSTLKPLINWGAPDYFGGLFQPDISNPVEQSGFLQSILVQKYNYSLLVSPNIGNTNTSDYTDTTKMSGKWVAIAKRNPSWHTTVLTFLSQLNNGYFHSQALPSNYYIKNSSGQFIDYGGAVSTTRFLSPAAPPTPLLNTDANLLKTKMNVVVNAMNPSVIDFISENDEQLKLIPTSTMLLDPAVVSDYGGSGQPNYRAYLGARWGRFMTNYRDTLLTLVPSANFLQYQMSAWDSSNGRNYYMINWSTYKTVQKNIGGRKYSTNDFYCRYPDNWRTWQGAWKGWQVMNESKYQEIQQGDKVNAPYVAPGWDKNEENNMRPGRWLGLLKALHLAGADFFHVGYFNEGSFSTSNPPGHPKGYAWQFAIPAYAHALCSRVDSIDMYGNYVADTYADPTKTSVLDGLNLWSGDPRILTICKRDSADASKYVLTTSLQPHSNQKGQVEASKEAKVKIGSYYYVFNCRPQGSTYYFDTDSSVCVYMDEWHELYHPERWTHDLYVEAENPDAVSGVFVNRSNIRTIFNSSVSGSTKYYTDFTTYMQGRNLQSSSLYYNLGFIDPDTIFLWVRARDITPVDFDTISLKIDVSSSLTWNGSGNKTAIILPEKTDTTWRWYRSGIVAGSNTIPLWLLHDDSELYHQLSMSFGPGIQIDKFVFTSNSDTVFSPEGNGTGGGSPYAYAPVTINQIGTFCTGDSVKVCAVMVDTTGVSGHDTIPVSDMEIISWSNGKTGDTIYVTSSGSINVYIKTVDYQPYLIGYDTTTVTSVSCDTVCSTPSNFRVDYIYRYSTRVRWNRNNTPIAYEVSVKDLSTQISTVTSVSGGGNPWIMIRNLRPNRNYSAIIRSYCKINGQYVFSSWSAPLYWKTNP